MLYAMNQALETNFFLGRLFGKLEGDRWARLMQKANVVCPTDEPTLVALEGALYSLTDP